MAQDALPNLRWATPMRTRVYIEGRPSWYELGPASPTPSKRYGGELVQGEPGPKERYRRQQRASMRRLREERRT